MKFFSFSSKKELFFYLLTGMALLVALGSFFTQQFSTPDTNTYSTEASITMFSREKCSHCQAEKKFWAQWIDETSLQMAYSTSSFSDPSAEYIQEQQNRFREMLKKQIQILDIEQNQEASQLFTDLTEEFQLSKSTPLTLVQNQLFVGFDSAENMGKKLTDYHTEYYAKNDKNFSFGQALTDKSQLHVFGAAAATCSEEADSECAIPAQLVKVPFFGEIDISGFQNPSVLSFTLGFIDGFNPCAMWVLVIFLLALIQIGDRVKMFITAGIFLLAEAVMYSLILTIWFSTWNFVGLDAIITPIVGFVALGSGFFFLHEGLFSDGTCKVTNVEQKKKISQRIQHIAHSPLTIPTLLGILALAFSVNIIEFACSIGIPQTFTQILHISDLPIWEKIWYIGIYILAYMIDDLIVFGIALYSIEKIGITHKYAKASNMLGGVLMLVLGALLIFAPQLLAFS